MQQADDAWQPVVAAGRHWSAGSVHTPFTQELVQHGGLASQATPTSRQALGWTQTSPAQAPEQQSPGSVQAPPSAVRVQAGGGVQTPPAQVALGVQHCTASTHEAPSAVQGGVEAQVPELQYPPQQVAAPEQPPPSAVQGGGGGVEAQVPELQ